jgi:bacterioferritin-associated ferredoxin
VTGGPIRYGIESDNHVIAGVEAVIVCLCRAVCDKEIRAVVGCGARSLEEVEEACGAGGDCGACQPDIVALLRQQQAARPAAPALAERALVLAPAMD